MSGEERFVTTARRFVSLVQDFEAHSADEFVRMLEPLLVDLYACALELDPRYVDDDSEADRMESNEWWELFKRLGSHLGIYDAYSFVFDPYDLEAEPVVGLLSDDLADIYRDLLEILELYEAGHTAAAAWQSRFDFDSHWGRHLAHALYALRIAQVG